MNAMARETQTSKEFKAVDDTTQVDAEYLELIATRGRSMPSAPQTTATHTTLFKE